MFRIFPKILAIATALSMLTDQAASQVPDCGAIAARVGTEKGLPEGLMRAIARVESGRRRDNGQFEGWPWTTNNAGDGRYFPDRISALEHIERLRSAGTTNIDIGCMQINWKWHADQFPSLDAMLDPEQNVRYAAKFLSKLYRRHGSWEKAIRFYHSGTERYNTTYLQRVRAAWPEEDQLAASADQSDPTSKGTGSGHQTSNSSAPASGFRSLWSNTNRATGENGTMPLISSPDGSVPLGVTKGINWATRLAQINGIDPSPDAQPMASDPRKSDAKDDT